MNKSTNQNGKTTSQSKGRRAAKGRKTSAPSKVHDGNVVKAPVAQTRVRETGIPNQERLRNGDVIVTHREFIQDINGSVDFQNNVFNINPGLPQVFPWLSSLARLFESYVLEKLEFEFQTMASTNTQGSVMAAVDYDVTDLPATTKVQLASYQGYKRSSPWLSFNNHSTTSNLTKRKTYYVRDGPPPPNSDLKLYDTGLFQLATQGMANADPVGELYCSYRVRFMTPQLNNVAVGASKSGRYALNPLSANANNNVPIIATGAWTTDALTFTATAPFDALVVASGVFTSGDPAVTFAGTATIQSPLSVANEQLWQAQCEVSMLPGQTLVVDAGAAKATAGTGGIRFSQFNTILL